ncbi:MAG: peptide-N-glycosidase F-related protein [bacterium]
MRFLSWKQLLSPFAAAALLLGFVGGCGDDDGSASDAGPDVLLVDGGADAEADAEVIPPSACEPLGLPERAFVDATEDTALRAMAADFTVPTTAGDWVLSERWSGCDSYLFILDWPAQNDPAFGYGMWEDAGDVEDLLAALPSNVHVFFVSVASAQGDRDAALEQLQNNILAAMTPMDPQDRDWWAERIHYVTSSAAGLSGWLGTVLQNPGFGIGIDRFQRIRYMGSYAGLNHYNGSLPWPFGHNVSMAANEAVYYNYEADRELALEAFPATTVTLFDATPVAAGGGGWFPVTVELPDAATMAGFDTFELDLTLNCEGPGEYGYCPAWDYNVFLNMCETVSATSCDLEVGHWITSYHREGRWVHDVSGLLPLLDDGGPHKFSFNISDPWEVTLQLRFSNQGKALRPSECIPLFAAGSHEFNETYNDNFSPVDLTIPADVQRVELHHAITGHGMSQPGNCAEFCDTYHHYYVNGADNVQHFPTTGNQQGCMFQIPEGTVPNQYGTWWFGRGGWCPGKYVPVGVFDITSQVSPGASNTFEYEGFYLNQPYTGDNWRNIHQASWVVIYR